MPRRQLTFPEAPPIALAQARAHVRERSLSFDSEILSKLNAAIAFLQAWANRQFLTADWEMTLDCFPVTGKLYLPPAPLASVESISYTDNDGNPAVWDPTEYTIDVVNEPGYLRPVDGASYPTGTDVLILYSCGYGEEWDTIPDEAREVIMLQTDELYLRADYGEKLAHLRRALAVGDVLEVYA